MGGGSRYDISSVGPLRALSAIVLAIAIWFQTRDSFALIRWPVTLIVLLAAWIAIQLIPLPPSLWTSLPGREAIVEAGAAIGLADTWRPITLSPQRSWNALASLIVPLAGLCLLALLDAKGWRVVRRMVVLLGITSGILGLAQLTMRGSPGLYLYEITNSDSAVGLFSNRNHNALFLNIALLFALFELEKTWISRKKAQTLMYASAAFVLLVSVLTNASRFGLVLLALIAAVFCIRLINVARNSARSSQQRRLQLAVGALAGVMALVLGFLFAMLGRIPALERMFEKDVANEKRLETLEPMLELAASHFPFGAGLGAFEQAYRIVEPTELLTARYLNHAHNDWLQIVIEGGLPGVVLLILGLAWLARAFLEGYASTGADSPDRTNLWCAVLTFVMIAAHSIVDYPLRTPSLMLVAIIAAATLCRAARKQAS